MIRTSASLQPRKHRTGWAPWPACLLVLIQGLSNPTWASSEICDRAAAIAARETGVPEKVLRAITRTETGRGSNHEPWPWTVNMQGKGKWFESEDAARSYVFSHFKTGARSFDVGCFQINYKWHGDAFRSIDEMFDPVINARYAAKFLARLYKDTGDWTDAAGAYHSRTPKYANRYKSRFEAIKASDNLVTSSTTERKNEFPLFRQSDERAGHGSLMPLEMQARQSLFGNTSDGEGL